LPRVKRGTKRRDKRKKILKRAKGYFLTKSKLYRAAQQAIQKAGKYAYRGRREKKRDFRSLWIVRIGAGARINGLSYSLFMHGLKLADIDLDRKVLSDMAINDAAGFASLADTAKAAVKEATAKAVEAHPNTPKVTKAPKAERPKKP
jgi:large subunit ribosomal protein L20